MKSYINSVLTFARNHPYLSAVALSTLYLVVFQTSFVFSGDAWAESYAEYIDESIRLGWLEVFAQNWAGYLTILPSSIAKAFVFFGGPLGYADYFLRTVVIIYTVFSASMVACKYNSPLVKDPLLRIALALGCVVALFDVSSFSFINVWYVGFIPVILYCLNPDKLSSKTELGIGLYGALMALSKPLVILPALIVYRMIRTRQYLGASILLVASSIQSYQIVFNDKRSVVESSSFDVSSSIGATLTGASTGVTKLLQIPAFSLWFLGIVLFGLIALYYLIYRSHGFWISSIVVAIYLFFVYTYVLAPDFVVYSGWHNYEAMSNFHLKSQREILINATLLIAGTFALDSLASKSGLTVFGHNISRRRLKAASYVLAALVIGLSYRAIDTSSSGVTNSPLDSFRSQLNDHRPTCVPLAPSKLFYPLASWHFSYGGTCQTLTHDNNLFTPNFNSFNTAIDRPFSYDAAYFRLNKSKLQAVVIPIRQDNDSVVRLRLFDLQSGRAFSAKTSPTIGIQLITFNVTGLKPRDSYEFRLSSSSPSVRGTDFQQSGDLVTYPYFLKNE